tara:strand:+ start:140 stop:1255 length:1116 start_codon:yes stop_codon:yes gene_type:complete
MIDFIRRYSFPTLIGLSALSVSASAAFYSVTGLSKLFAGASLEVIVMAGSLEVAKLVIASLLYRYWSILNKVLRVYLSLATLILILITSMGIYGFLSAAYQDTYRQLTIKENQVTFLEEKRDFFQKDLNRVDAELERISQSINSLSNAKATSIQVRDTTVEGGVRTTVSTAELRLAQDRIKAEEENRAGFEQRRVTLSDSVQKYNIAILDLENNTEVAGELGPLQYLSELTGYSMDKVINILLLVIIFVFDPLAISLVIAANFAFEKAKPVVEENVYGEKFVDGDLWEELEPDLDLPNIGQEQPKEDTPLEKVEIEDLAQPKANEQEIKQSPRKVKTLEETARKEKVVYDNGKIEWIEKDFKDNDNTIRYL